MKLKMKKRKGFTLVEMVLVITILGILSSIAFMKFGGVQKRAEENADYIVASNLAMAINLAKSEKAINSDNVDLKILKDKGYITEIPKPQSVRDGSFKAEIQDEEVVIKLNEKTIYPKDYKESTTP